MNTKVHRVASSVLNILYFINRIFWSIWIGSKSVFSVSFFCDAEIPNLWPIHSFLIITIRENTRDSDTNKVVFHEQSFSMNVFVLIYSLTQVYNPIFRYNFMWILLIQNMSVDPIFRALNSQSVWIKMTHSESKIGQKIDKKLTAFFLTVRKI